MLILQAKRQRYYLAHDIDLSHNGGAGDLHTSRDQEYHQ